MKDVFNTWRGFILERQEFFGTAPQGKGESLEEMRIRWDTFKQNMKTTGNVWIFYDTETTGLKPENDEVQITELAAGAYDFRDWFNGTGQPKQLKISNIPANYKLLIAPNGEFSTKVKLTPVVKNIVRRERRLMAVDDKNDPLHVNYAQDEIARMASKEAFKQLEAMHKENPDAGLMYAKKPGAKKLDPTKAGWNEWRLAKQNFIDNTTPEQIPFYSESHTDNIKEAGWGPNDRKATLVALLKMGRYGSGQAPFEKDDFVYSAFTEFLEVIKNNSGESKFGLAAHNAPFDIAQLNMAYQKAGVEVADVPVYDSIEAFKSHLVPIVQDTLNKMKNGEEVNEIDERIANAMNKKNKAGRDYISVSLGPVVDAFQLPDLGWHAAIADVRMTAAMFIAAINYIEDWFDRQGVSQIQDFGSDEEQELSPYEQNREKVRQDLERFKQGGEPPEMYNMSGAGVTKGNKITFKKPGPPVGSNPY